MKKLYTLAAIILAFSANAQIINIPDANFKAALLQQIDANSDGEIQISEAANVAYLNIPNLSIASLEGIWAFTGLQSFNCSGNNLTSIDLSMLPILSSVNLSGNQLSTLSSAQFTAAIVAIDCSYNLLTTLNLNALSNLAYFDCSHNQLTALNIEQINDKIRELDCSYNNLTSLNVPNFFAFQDMGDQWMTLNCSHNQLSQISFDYSAGREEFTTLNLSYNNFSDLTLMNTVVYGDVVVSYNPLNNLNFDDFLLTEYSSDDDYHGRLYINNTNLSHIELPGGNTDYSTEINNNPNLISVDMKNGVTNIFYNVIYVDDQEVYVPYGVTLDNNPLLAWVCCDVSDISYVSSLVPGIAVTEYCTFTPGGGYNTITGNVMLGCPTGTIVDSNIRVNIGSVNNVSFNSDGNYIFYTGTGIQNVSLSLPHPAYFTVTPPNYSFSFTNSGNAEIANFCLEPNGYHPDLESTIIAVTPARPGFDASYKIVYENKGTETQSGNVTLQFNDAVLDLISSNPVATASPNMLTWAFTNLQPFESREVIVTFNVNSPVETPGVNIGDILSFTSDANSVLADETPDNNIGALRQTVVGSFDPNDKAVDEGSTIDINEIDNYLHYVIRFQNTGTFAAENVVVTDMLALADFDMSTVQMIGASHPYRSTFIGSKLEVIFEGINLPASIVDEPASHGFIAFKVKPKSNLGVGSVIENKASIYFDFNFPIVTNTTATTVTVLGNQQFDLENNVMVYPNPVANILNIELQSGENIEAIRIYNTLGQLIKSFRKTEASNKSNLIVNDLKTGTYFIEIISTGGKAIKKLIKL